MSASWRYRTQVVTLAIWRRLPKWARSCANHALTPRAQRRAGAAELATVLAKSQRASVLCLPIIDWGRRVQRPQHLLGGLARHGWPVLYVGKELGRGRTPLLGRLAPGVVSVTLPGGSGSSVYRGVPRADEVDRWTTVLDELLRERLDRRDAVVFVEWPYWTPLALTLRNRFGWRVVYDCLDEHSAHPASDPAVVALEAELVARADVVLASSRLLLDRCRATARRCELLPNACEFDHFATPPATLPGTRIGRPVIGYFGAIAEWFAPALLEHAARSEPTWQFVLIGMNSGADLGRLGGLRNVHLLGELPYRDLPGWLHRFDVATIPFAVTPLTLATNPVKLFEYFAAGKPVVATALPEIVAFEPLCYPATTPQEFTAQLHAALTEQDPAKKRARIAVARANTWETRIGVLERVLSGITEG